MLRYGKACWVIKIILCIWVLTDSLSFAEDALGDLVTLYQGHSRAWEQSLASLARGLFWSLAGIEFTWMAIRLAFRQAALGDWVQELTNRIFFIGFFWALLQNSPSWTQAIIQSFRTAADTANASASGIPAITPSTLLERGVQMFSVVLEHTNLLKNPLDNLVVCIAAIVILVCFAFIAAELIQALIESYIITSAGILFLGFGGSNWTAEFAKKILLYTLSVGAKLFVLQLLIGLGSRFIDDLATRFEGGELKDILIMIGISIVFFAVTKNVPNMIQNMVSGASFGSSNLLSAGNALGAMGLAAASTMASMATGSVANTMAGSEALKLANEQLGAEGRGEIPRQGPSTLMGKAAHNLYKAGKQDLGARITGRIPEYGTTAGRMAAIMQDQRAQLKKPQLPEGSQTSGNSISG